MPENKPPPSKRLDTDRLLGVLVALGGLAAMYYFIIRQAIAATRHDPRVFLSLKGVMLSPVALALGVVYAIYGGRMSAALADTKGPTRTTWILIVSFCVADCGLYEWLKHFIESYGYVFSH